MRRSFVGNAQSLMTHRLGHAELLAGLNSIYRLYSGTAYVWAHRCGETYVVPGVGERTFVGDRVRPLPAIRQPSRSGSPRRRRS